MRRCFIRAQIECDETDSVTLHMTKRGDAMRAPEPKTGLVLFLTATQRLFFLRFCGDCRTAACPVAGNAGCFELRLRLHRGFCSNLHHSRRLQSRSLPLFHQQQRTLALPHEGQSLCTPSQSMRTRSPTLTCREAQVRQGINDVASMVSFVPCAIKDRSPLQEVAARGSHANRNCRWRYLAAASVQDPVRCPARLPVPRVATAGRLRPCPVGS